jgi:hypothetical protein
LDNQAAPYRTTVIGSIGLTGMPAVHVTV